MRKYTKAFLLILIALVVVSCKTDVKQKNKVFLVLFDISVSVKQDEMVKNYLENFGKIICKANEGDVVVAGLISEKSISELSLPVNFRFGTFTPTVDNKLIKEAENSEFLKAQQAQKDSLCVVVDTLIHMKRVSEFTDIFSSLQLAEKVFKSYKDCNYVLVLLSDMVESTREYDFDKETLTPKRCDEIIDQKEKKGEIPDLNGVKVYVIGANYKTPEKFNEIQKFWLKYFKQCKANLSDNNYNSALINFNE